MKWFKKANISWEPIPPEIVFIIEFIRKDLSKAHEGKPLLRYSLENRAYGSYLKYWHVLKLLRLKRGSHAV